jgi:1,5-anhydro-D-fructose reductase (1,5-anhydro-D-mannitol-forming)
MIKLESHRSTSSGSNINSSGLLKLYDPNTCSELVFEPIPNAPGQEPWGFWKDTQNPSFEGWPQIDGIIFLNASRHDLAKKICTEIRDCKWAHALAYALSDSDNYALQFPRFEIALEIAENYLLNPDKTLDVSGTMEALNYGRVCQYFQLRPNTPSFFSGLGLLNNFLNPSNLFVDLCCGIGHFSSILEEMGIQGVCVDFVFSKLWISRKARLVQSFQMIAADLESGEMFPFSTSCGSASFFCHDAFYFFKNKQKIIDRISSNFCRGSQILIGHAHLSDQEHGIVSGYPLTREEYHSLFSDDTNLQIGPDLELANDFLDSIDSSLQYLSTNEAIYIVQSSTKNFPPVPTLGLLKEAFFVASPFAAENSAHELSMQWPDDLFRKEFDLATKRTSMDSPKLPSDGPMYLSGSIDLRVMQPSFFSTVANLPIKWGVVGMGWVANDFMIPSFQYSPQSSLQAIIDSDPQAFAEFTGDFGEKIECRSSLEDLEDPSGLDAIYISTPNDQHLRIIEQASSLGINILCEKPICTNLKDLHKAVSFCKEAGVRLKSAYNQRYHPAHQLIKTLLAKKELGQVTQIRIHYACWLSEDWSRSSVNWRIDRQAAGGGASIDLIPHGLDLCSFLLRTSFQSITLERQNLVHSYSQKESAVDDGAIAQFKTRCGILGTVQCGYNCPDPLPRRQLEIIGTEGRIYALNTLGQEAGGHLKVTTLHGSKEIDFPNDHIYSPFVRQLDKVSREWLKPGKPSLVDETEIETMAMFLKALQKS